MDNTKFYWLRLTQDFYDREEIKLVRSMQNGAEYIIFYQQLLLKSINTEGILMFKDAIPYDPKMLSTITNTDIDTIKAAIDIFTKLKMIEVLDNGAIFMNEVQKLIGTSTKWAKYKRIQRARNQIEKQFKDDNFDEKENAIRLHKEAEKRLSKHASNKDSLDMSKKCPKNVHTDIELELEKDIYNLSDDRLLSSNDDSSQKNEISKIQKKNVPYKEIIDTFNKICGEVLPTVKLVNEVRRRNINARFRNELKDLESWEKFFTKIADSDFLMGRAQCVNGTHFRCSFDWAIQPRNCAKILENHYSNYR